MVRVGYARVGLALGMYIPCCSCRFHWHWVPNANPFLLEYGTQGKKVQMKILDRQKRIDGTLKGP